MAERPPRARRGAALAAIAVGGATGAVVGGFVGAALHEELWRAALVGTAAGATGGLVVHAVAR